MLTVVLPSPNCAPDAMLGILQALTSSAQHYHPSLFKKFKIDDDK